MKAISMLGFEGGELLFNLLA